MAPAASTINALDPRRGSSPLDRFVPLVVALATVAVAVSACFGLVPGMNAASGIALLAGTGGGIFIRSQG